jgi:hypothetical protein
VKKLPLESEPAPVYDHIYFWGKSKLRPLDRKGQKCRILRRETFSRILVEFEGDKFQTILSRFSIRRLQSK